MNVYEGKTQELVYVGRKAVKRDTVAGTGIIWGGYGDAQEVPHAAAVKMLQHPDVWVTRKVFEDKYPAKSPHTKSAPAPKSKGGVDFSALSQVPATDDGDQDHDDQGDNEGNGDSSEGGEENQESENSGDDPASAVEVAKAAILSLDSNNPEHFGQKGPKIDAVRAAAGDASLDLKTVNAAWKELNNADG